MPGYNNLMGLFTGVTNRFVRFRDVAAILLGLMVFGGGVHADGPGLPANICHDSCGPRQHQMWSRFERGESPDISVLPRVYAGVCHVFGNNVNPDREHHVGFMIDADNDTGEHRLHLRFSFFTPRQPYDKLTAEQARESFDAPVLPLSVHDGYAYAEVIDQWFFARYWLRRDRERTLLVIYFGHHITILCDAGANRY